jgi:hypothetical protein
MNRREIMKFSALAGFSVVTLASGAIAQQKPLKDQLIGTWSLVSYESVEADEGKKPVFASSKGYLMLDPGGHYTYIVVDMTRKKWNSNNRTQTSVEEYAAAAKGLVAQFGSWSVDEASKTLTRKVEGALNPGLPNVEQKWSVVTSGDEIRLTDVSSQVTGGRTEQVYRRSK